MHRMLMNKKDFYDNLCNISVSSDKSKSVIKLDVKCGDEWGEMIKYD